MPPASSVRCFDRVLDVLIEPTDCHKLVLAEIVLQACIDVLDFGVLEERVADKILVGRIIKKDGGCQFAGIVAG